MATECPASARDHDGVGAALRRCRPAWWLLAGALLLWPVLWNGYPIVFADTGTYLSQAVHHYAGWDRPVFYSLFILPLHATITLWPIVATQALIAVYVLTLASRVFLADARSCPEAPLAVPPLVIPPLAVIIVLAALTWLPFLVSEVMPDLFTPLLVLVMAVLAWAPDRIDRRERWLLVPLATFMTASQQSSVPLAATLAVTLGGLALWRRHLSPALLRAALLVPILAMAALVAMNFVAHHRLSLSPYGSVFYLARLVADGPASAELRRTCPQSGWRLCAYQDRLPMDSDLFLWTPDSPLNEAGGPKALAAEAGAIIAETVRHQPARVLAAAVADTGWQLGQFSSGDGLEPWTRQVSPWLAADFPAWELDRYNRARQQQGRLVLPYWLAMMHWTLALAGLLACLALLPTAWRRRQPVLGALVAVLLALPLSAAITGALSGPHDRYQSRLMWLPPFVAILAAGALLPSPSRSGSAKAGRPTQ